MSYNHCSDQFALRVVTRYVDEGSKACKGMESGVTAPRSGATSRGIGSAMDQAVQDDKSHEMLEMCFLQGFFKL